MPDNEARRQAEDQIKRLSKDPQVIPALVHHLRTAKTPNVRQLAAILLRKKIAGHWAKLLPQLRSSIKSALIDSITSEHSSTVRRASANVVSIVAKCTVPSGEWPELLPFLFESSQSSQEDHREVALILFSFLTETIGSTFQSNLVILQPILLKCLQDESSPRVRVAALKAIGSCIEFINEGANVVKPFHEFVPSILNFSRQCLANGENDVAIIAFEIFDELIESPAPLLGDSVRLIVQFSLEVCSSPNLALNVRHQAIQIISWLAKFRAKFLKKHKLLVPILQIMCPLLTETNPDNDDDDDISADRASAEVIDTIALNLPKLVFSPILEFASLNIHNKDLKYREASATVLGIVSEGCLNFMKDKLEHVLHIVLEAFKDQEQLVRGAASFALGQFAEHLQPEILSYYESVLPCIVEALEDASDDIKEKSYYALAALCENMDKEILPYLDPLMGKLLTTLQQGPRNLQETCMSAIGSIAAAAGQAFMPYAEGVLDLMKSFMVLTNDEDLRSRARATELVGIIAMAVGRTKMESVLPPYIEAAILGFSLDFSELREYTNGFFSNLSEVLDDGFTQYLPHVVPLVFSSCNLDDGSSAGIDDSDDDVSGFGGVSSDEDVVEPRVRNISIRTGIMDEKAAATQSIGLFALHTKSSYSPYLDDSLKILVRHAGYFHEDVRLQAIISLQHLLTAVWALPADQNEVIRKQKEILDNVMTVYVKRISEDDDKEVVAQVCTSISSIMENCDYMAVKHYIPQLIEVTLLLLQEKMTCQQVESESENEDDDVNHDEVLMDAVSDLLPSFAKSMGSDFEPIFSKLFDPLMKFTKVMRSAQDHTMVVACLAEVAQNMGAPISSYVNKIMPLVLKELASPNPTNRRNAAFCVGELCKNGGTEVVKYYGDVLCALSPLFGEQESDDAVRDNACGAVARMLMAQPKFIPLSQVIPVLLKALPLKEDLEESMIVYSCICNLVLSFNAQILPLVPEIVRLFAQVVSSPAESNEVKSRIGMTFTQLLSFYGQKMNPILSSLSSAEANALASFLSKR
ncbi:Importin-4 [Zostera marina]|uniref:Importin-4 n=1 Tax=Zostera marina TaxID=29655 RepID=A0A0K9Q6B7_ZOSMR|nr:Importin-4 [Zostera marina]